MKIKKNVIILGFLLTCLFSVFFFVNNDSLESNKTYKLNKESKYIHWTNNSKNITDNKKIGIQKVHSSSELKHIISKENCRLIIDKDILEEEANVKFLNAEIKRRPQISVIILGYGNPTYVFFKKLLINAKQAIPEFTSKEYKRMSMKKGFSVAYKAADGNIYGKGYNNEKQLKEVLSILLKKDEDIKDFLNLP